MASISNDVHCQEKLSNLYKMLSHLHGPSSQHIAINNKLVCSAFELYHSITPTDDVINLMFGFLLQQNERYKNGGSAMGILATILIQEYLKFDVPIGTIMDNNELILSTFVEEIRTLSVKCNIGRFSDVTKIIRPILMSKLLLTREESKHLCLTFARVFTMDNFWNDSHVIKLENEAILKTSLNDGLVLRLEQYTNFPNELTDVKVILYSVSIALDSEEVLEGGSKFDYQVESRSDLKESLLNGNVLRTCRLMHGLVQLIVCQKVIHPRAKKWFKDNAIYCIDRVGKACMKKLETICQCIAVNNLSETDLSSYLGHISLAKRVNLIEKNFLRLENVNVPQIKTVILCAEDEIRLNALDICYEQTLTALDTVSKTENVLYGGGCSITRLLMKMVKEHGTMTHFRVYVTSLLKLCQAVSRTDILHHCIDLTFHHHWITGSPTCCCGIVKKSSTMEFVNFLELNNNSYLTNYKLSVVQEDFYGREADVFESEEMFIHIISSAFQLANMVLRIGAKVVSKPPTT